MICEIEILFKLNDFTVIKHLKVQKIARNTTCTHHIAFMQIQRVLRLSNKLEIYFLHCAMFDLHFKKKFLYFQYVKYKMENEIDMRYISFARKRDLDSFVY